MKVCSKCQQSLPETSFVKSARYKDGLYPSCKACRNQIRMLSLKNNPMCARCHSKPHTESHPYCYDCQRASKGEPAVPKFRRDSSNTTMCSRCKQNPRAPGKHYCRDCANQYLREWSRSKGGYWKSRNAEQKRKSTVRMFVDHKIHRGQITRQPCLICGKPETEIHHLNYEQRTLDVIHICASHHVQLEKLKRQGLTDQQGIEYLSKQLADSQPPAS